ncbi:MAG: hypothetical protein ACFFEE_00600 [Candidatus Thorarchaeota archaeon]
MKDQSGMKKRAEISKILDALGSPEDVRQMITRLLQIADKYDILDSKNHLGEATGLVYIAGILTSNPVTLATIAKIAGLSAETVLKYKTHLAGELKTKKEWPGLPSKVG